MWFNLVTSNNNSYYVLGIYYVTCSRWMLVIILLLQIDVWIPSFHNFIKSVSGRAKIQTLSFSAQLLGPPPRGIMRSSILLIQEGFHSHSPLCFLWDLISDMQLRFEILQSPILASSVFSLGFLEYIGQRNNIYFLGRGEFIWKLVYIVILVLLPHFFFWFYMLPLS